MRHEVGYTLEKFRVEATIPNRKKGETIVTPEKASNGFNELGFGFNLDCSMSSESL
jgi:hypothetical protein